MKQGNKALVVGVLPGSVTAGFAHLRRGDTDEQLANRADDLYRVKAHRTIDHRVRFTPSCWGW